MWAKPRLFCLGFAAFTSSWFSHDVLGSNTLYPIGGECEGGTGMNILRRAANEYLKRARLGDPRSKGVVVIRERALRNLDADDRCFARLEQNLCEAFLFLFRARHAGL